MAESNKVTKIHIQNLANLRRICGNHLMKLGQTYQATYSCKDYREFLEKNFQINPEKDDPAIHPPRFCNSCFATHTRERVYWEIHTDKNCSTYSREEKAKKGGRPKRSKWGGGKHILKTMDDTRNTTSSTKTIQTVLKEKVKKGQVLLSDV